MTCRWAVPEIEPFLSPALDIFPHQEVEVLDFLPDDETKSADNMRTFASAVALDKENFPPKTPVGVNAEVSLADGDKDGQMENGVWGQLPKLNPIRKEKVAEELVGWGRQPTVQKSRKHNGKTIGRLWTRYMTWVDEV
jgi:hypothetical protein